MTNTLNLDAIFEAAIFAALKHQGQVRKDKGASPYITHPLAVAREIFSTGKVDDPNILIAALLHDTIEDTKTSADEIRSRFGEEVLSTVLEVTDDKKLPKEVRKLQQIIHAPELSYAARIIKIADKLVNCRDILNTPPQEWDILRRREYIQWAANVVAQIRDTNPHLEAAFDKILIEAEASLNFHLKPFTPNPEETAH
jgi:guanosine-3',5'-bis(diphosphate) 3'-pyrophosphohydrolase